jgi:hypothetical protein
MNALDFHQPPPQAHSLEEAQALIDPLWMLGRVAGVVGSGKVLVFSVYRE